MSDFFPEAVDISPTRNHGCVVTDRLVTSLTLSWSQTSPVLWCHTLAQRHVFSLKELLILCIVVLFWVKADRGYTCINMFINNLNQAFRTMITLFNTCTCICISKLHIYKSIKSVFGRKFWKNLHVHINILLFRHHFGHLIFEQRC